MSSSDRKNFSFSEEKHNYSYQADTQSLRPLKFTIDGDSFLPKNTPKHGKYGNVDIFTNAQGKAVVVKTPREPIANKDNHIEKYKREVNILKKIYGNMGLYAIHFYALENKPGHFAYAMLLPYFPNINLDEGMAQASSEALIINYLLLTAMEIDRIHSEHGIIHNDIKGNNFRLDTVNNKVRGIDFYHATYNNGSEEINFEATQAKRLEVQSAPELRAEAKGSHTPSTASDMHSFGSMLSLFLQHATSWFPSTEKSIYTPQTTFYPSFIWKFQDLAMSGHPGKRPTFKSFIETLGRIATQPRSLQIQYAFSTDYFHNLQLKINNKLYSPTKGFPGGTNSYIELYDTPVGQFRVKFEVKSRYHQNTIDSMAYSASLYPEEMEDLNRAHTLFHHPSYKANQCPHHLFSVTRYHPGISFMSYCTDQMNLDSPLKQLRVLLAITRAIQQIHEQGYIIANIKPQNIIIDLQKDKEKPQVKINNLYWAYRRDAAYAKTADCDQNTTIWHPNTMTERLTPPSLSYDDFSFTATLLWCKTDNLLKDPKTKEIILHLYQAIKTNPSESNPINLTWLIEKLAAEEPRLLAAEAKAEVPAPATIENNPGPNEDKDIQMVTITTSKPPSLGK